MSMADPAGSALPVRVPETAVVLTPSSPDVESRSRTWTACNPNPLGYSDARFVLQADLMAVAREVRSGPVGGPPVYVKKSRLSASMSVPIDDTILTRTTLLTGGSGGMLTLFRT